MSKDRFGRVNDLSLADASHECCANNHYVHLWLDAHFSAAAQHKAEVLEALEDKEQSRRSSLFFRALARIRHTLPRLGRSKSKLQARSTKDYPSSGSQSECGDMFW